MYLVKQKFPLISVLRVGQIMDSYAVARKIEQASEESIRNVCMRFYAIQNGKDIWISGEEFNNAGGMREFLEDFVHLEEKVIDELCDRDYEVIATEGDCLELSFVNGEFDWEKFGLITRALEDYPEDVVRAACNCGVALDKLSEQYKGHYKSFVAFVEEEWDEMYMSQVPEFMQNYIDYEKIAADWDGDGTYIYEEGYVFNENV